MTDASRDTGRSDWSIESNSSRAPPASPVGVTRNVIATTFRQTADPAGDQPTPARHRRKRRKPEAVTVLSGRASSQAGRFEVEILDAKPQTLFQPESRAVQQHHHESLRAGELSQKRRRLPGPIRPSSARPAGSSGGPAVRRPRPRLRGPLPRGTRRRR